MNIVTKKVSRRRKSNSRPGQKAGLTATTTTMRTWRRSAAAMIMRLVACPFLIRRYGGWYDGKRDEVIIEQHL